MQKMHDRGRIGVVLMTIAVFLIGGWFVWARSATAEEVKFEIREFEIDGNTIFHDGRLVPLLTPFIGMQKTATDVENARAALEQYHHQHGYPTVLVNIPEQSVTDGTVRLEIIESKIRRVKVAGNRYFTRESLLREMPAFTPGEILYLPLVKEQLARVNRNPDLKVAPILMPGKQLGTIDVEFRVKDKLPLHGEVELNNRTTHTTTETRLNGLLRYDNLWQKDHSVMVRYQMTPEDTDEVKLLMGSYSLPSPLNPDHLISLYCVWSDSATATSGNITVVGEGQIYGMRYQIPLPSFKSYIHDLTLGLDYKDFEDVVADEIATPVQYLPLNALYTAVMPDGYGQTGFSLGLNFNLRQASSDIEDFQNKRSQSQGNYVVFKANLQRDQKLIWDTRLWLQTDAQWANQSLISNEQYIAGGINSVRGYMENEAAGDTAWHGSAEFRGPDVGAATGIGKWLECTPYLFYDVASVRLIHALSGENTSSWLSGTGVGLRGYIVKHFEYEIDWALALNDTEDTDVGDQLVHFIVKFSF